MRWHNYIKISWNNSSVNQVYNYISVDIFPFVISYMGWMSVWLFLAQQKRLGKVFYILDDHSSYSCSFIYLCWIMQWAITATVNCKSPNTALNLLQCNLYKTLSHSFFIALPTEGGLCVSNASRWHSVQNSKPTAWLQKYCKDRQAERHQGTRLWSVFDPTRDAVLLTKNLRNPSFNARQLKVANNFPHMNI